MFDVLSGPHLCGAIDFFYKNLTVHHCLFAVGLRESEDVYLLYATYGVYVFVVYNLWCICICCMQPMVYMYLLYATYGVCVFVVCNLWCMRRNVAY